MSEVAETPDISPGFIHNVVTFIDGLGGLPTHTPQACMDDHGFLTSLTCYSFKW